MLRYRSEKKELFFLFLILWLFLINSLMAFESKLESFRKRITPFLSLFFSKLATITKAFFLITSASFYKVYSSRIILHIGLIFTFAVLSPNVQLSKKTKKDFMHPILTSTLLLVCSNVFMTFAWYAHLKDLNAKPWFIAAIASWGIALFEYLLQVPANRIGFTAMNLGQLKILQEVISLTIFIPFAIYYMKEPIKLDYLWAFLCIMGAVFFIFRSKIFA